MTSFGRQLASWIVPELRPCGLWLNRILRHHLRAARLDLARPRPVSPPCSLDRIPENLRSQVGLARNSWAKKRTPCVPGSRSHGTSAAFG